MKSRLVQIVLFVLLKLGFGLAEGNAQGTFQNLNFESGVPIPPGAGTHFVDFGSAFPGWVGYVGTQQLTTAFYPDLTLGTATITLKGIDSIYGSRIAGNYTAVIQSGVYGFSTVSASLAQTGLIPSGTASLRYLAGEGASLMTVLINGQPLNVMPLQTFNGYSEYGADVSSFADQPVELRFVVPYLIAPRDAYLDNISFSPIPVVPEPSTWALFILGGAVFWFGMHRRRSK